jgi:hypothetical protein
LPLLFNFGDLHLSIGLWVPSEVAALCGSIGLPIGLLVGGKEREWCARLWSVGRHTDGSSGGGNFHRRCRRLLLLLRLQHCIVGSGGSNRS